MKHFLKTGFFLCCLIAFRCVAQNEVIYHVFQRSFYDANGDGQGDLKGLKEKLGYLQGLGVTSILMTPLYASAFYHNYFADNFEKIDPAFGSFKEYLDLVKEVHRRKMKIYLDMETQYVTESHHWWEAVGNTRSAYKSYIQFDDSSNLHPSPMLFGITVLKGYDGTLKKVGTVNLLDKGVLAYNEYLFGYFMDPDGDGQFDDGVDGFRLDHMMDDLDWKGTMKDLFSRFWTPLLDSLRKINPSIRIVAEQANWGSFGFEYFEKGGVDRVFAFRLAGAISSFDKHQIAVAADTTLGMLPPGKEQVVFIENHDLDRFAFRVKKDPGKERVGAVLNLLLGGIPSIYYGQELGMFGGALRTNFGTDANDIPRREAFEWYGSDIGKGMALWYKGSGPWWDSTSLKPWDGVSLEEEQKDPHSLWHFYKSLLMLRKEHQVLGSGRYAALENNNPSVFTFLRIEGENRALVAVNLSATAQEAQVAEGAGFRQIFGNGSAAVKGGGLNITLPPYGECVMEKER